LKIRRPNLALLKCFSSLPRVARRSEVVYKSVDPDVDGVLGVVGHSDTPRKAGERAGNGKVVEVG
jgi:hypothetical protein